MDRLEASRVCLNGETSNHSPTTHPLAASSFIILEASELMLQFAASSLLQIANKAHCPLYSSKLVASDCNCAIF